MGWLLPGVLLGLLFRPALITLVALQVDAVRSASRAAGWPWHASLQPAHRTHTGTRCYRQLRELLQGGEAAVPELSQARHRTPTAKRKQAGKTAQWVLM